VPLKPIAWYTSLATHKARMREQAFLIEGPRAVRQIAGFMPDAIREVLIDETVDAGAWGGFPLRQLTGRQMAAVCSAQTSQGVAAVVSIPDGACSDILPTAAGGRVLLLEEVQDPGNVGTLIRTAAAFGWSGVALCNGCADPFAPKALQASAGAIMAVWTRRCPDSLSALTELKKRGFAVVAADGGGTTTLPVHYQRPVVLMLGNEGHGLSDGLISGADTIYRIPIQADAVESLNVAIAGAIAMFQLSTEVTPPE
jgi:TrmH family RNA methyltransferase